MKGSAYKIYLIQHYKGKYRLLCPYDLKNKDYNRKLNGKYEDVDVYIDCYQKVKIFYYGQSILEVYVPSLTRGRNLLKQIKDLDNNIIQYTQESDSEVIFRFHSKYLNQLVSILKPKTSGAAISPFSTKNLPLNKSYKIPNEELSLYKEIVQKLPQERILEITHATKLYLKTIITKSNSFEELKMDMRKRGLKGKEYIHAIGKWNDYITFLKENINGN